MVGGSGALGGVGPGANPMSFTEGQHGSVVLERLREQRSAGRFCDVVLVVQGNRFPAHRNILAAGSPYLDSILRHSRVVKEEVRVNCGNPEAFALLLNYMYSGSVVLNNANVLHLLRLANNFLVSKLKNYCAEYLDRYLDPVNVLTVRELASKYNMPGLAKNATLFLEANLGRVVQTAPQPLEWALARIEAFFQEQPISAAAGLGLALRWVAHAPEERGDKLKQLLAAFVPIASLDPGSLSRLLETEPVLNACEPARFALLQAMYESSLPLLAFQPEYQRLLAKYSGEVNIYFNTTNPEPDPPPPPLPDVNGGEEREEEGAPPRMEAGELQIKEELTDEAFFSQGGQGTSGAPEPPVSPIRTVPLVNGVPTPGAERPSSPPPPYGIASPEPRPPLRLTLKIPLMTRKAKLLGARRKTPAVEAATQIVKRRGRPPKARLPVPSATSDSPVYLPARPGEDSAKVMYRCPHCVYTSACGSRITAHMEKAHSRNRTFDCNLCQFSCRWNREYYAHMKSHFGGPPFACDSCSYAAERIQMLLTHRMKHTDERPFTCPDCDYRCRTRTNLVSHQRSHTGERPFTCPECGRGFAIKSTLDQHLATHSDTRPFKCDTCAFSTKYQSHLISHKRIHSGDVFHCQFADCSYSSPKKSQLAAHLRTHLAVRAFQCRLCPRSFIEKSHLVRHERIHLQDKPFKCQNCDYASSRRDKLKEHILKHHNGTEEGATAATSAPGSGTGTRGPYRRRYRRPKTLATLSTTGSISGGPASVSSRSDRDGDLVSETSEPPSSFRPITPPSGVPVDLASILAPSPHFSRPHSAIFPAAVPGSHALQPSPALSLNLSLDNLHGRVAKDVLLSAVAPTPTLDDAFPPATTTPTGDLQRPMSLPPLGQGLGNQLPDFSFTAMF